jgi:predicted RNA-binding Zn-ribbon protein involved in translation (DUF1610 family)
MMRRLALGLTLLAVVAGVAIFYQSASIMTRGGEGAPLYSVRRYDPYGTAAVAELLSDRGVPVHTLERPSLEADDHGVLLQVLPPREAMMRQHEIQVPRLMDWMADGNTVVQFTHWQTDLMRKCKIEASQPPDGTLLGELQVSQSKGEPPAQTPAAVRTATWSLSGDNPQPDHRLMLWSPMVLKEDAAWRPIAWLDAKTGQKREIVAGEYRVGKGRLIIVGAPTPALNATIAEGNNLDFLLAIAGDGPVIIDEWAHGVGHEATIIGFLRSVGLLPALIQMGLLAALYVWSTSGRSRRDRTAGARQRSSIEQIATLGFLYSQSLNVDVAMERVHAEVMRRVAEAMRCQPEEIKGRLATTGATGIRPETRTRVQQLLHRLNQIGRGRGPRCQSCGYDLTLNTSGRCPECGTEIPLDLRQRIQETAAVSNLPVRGRRRRASVETGLADALTLSHQIVQEVKRDRSAR